jgi:hypothetical protein
MIENAQATLKGKKKILNHQRCQNKAWGHEEKSK